MSPAATARRAAPARLRVGRREVSISSPDKALFSRPRVTKLELARYYEEIAPFMLPHLRDRPLSAQAYPSGVGGGGSFFLQAVPGYFPSWIGRATVPKRERGTITHVVARDAPTLVYLVGQNVVVLHSWLSRFDEPDQPDRIVFDFDPSPGATFADVRAAALDAGRRLRDAGLVTFAKVTGSRGVHVVCPLRRGPSFSAVHAWARGVAEAMVADDPRRLTLVWRRSERGARVYVDINRIGYAQTAVVPYGVRARPGAPVALPIRWDELSSRSLAPDGWGMEAALARVRQEGDAWAGMGRYARGLPG